MAKDFLSYTKERGNTNYTNTPMTPTGFMYFDFANGKKHVCYDDNENITQVNNQVGIVNGSLISIIGKSGTGKTTLALQIAASLVNPFLSEVLNKYVVEKSDMEVAPLIEIYDAEQKFDISLAKRTMQYPNKLLKKICAVHRDKKDTDIIKRMNEHIEYKKQYMKKMKYIFKDIYNDNYIGYPPSVILIDSLNQIESSAQDNYESSIATTAGLLKAKAIQNMLNEMSKIGQKYNITIISIQHILADANLGFIPKSKQYLGLKKDEKLVAGEKSILLSTNIIRLEFVDFIGEKALGNKSKTYVNMGDGQEGFIVYCTIIKSTTNAMGRVCRLVNIGDHGFNRLLSTFYEATLRGDVEKKGNFYYIPGVDDKFTIKNFLEKVKEDHTIMIKFYEHMNRKLKKYISNDFIEKGIKSEKEEIRDDFFNMDDDDDI